ncbi:MAG TPA: c-type cytochrome [Chloroflexota bacterium]|nr:c-type cytochrome [Chloroflexota bacterium]
MSLDNPAPLVAALALVAILVGVLWYAARISVPTTELPAGPPTGAAAMERKVAATVAMMAGMALLFLGYGLREGDREVEAQEAQLDTSIGRGIENFSSLCFPCHGEKGQGAVVPDSNPIRLAPPLNRPDLRPTDPDERKKEYDFIFKTIQRGRPGTPMPAWGQTDGGTLLDEHINELALMVLNGDREMMFEGTRATPWEHVEELVKEHVAQGTGQLPQQPQVEQLPFYQQLNPQEQQGVRVILQRGCGGCHTIPNVPGASGNIGPDLAGVADRKMIAGGAVPNNSPQDLAAWILDPPSLKPGTAMPKLGLSQDEGNAAAAYLYTLHAGGS